MTLKEEIQLQALKNKLDRLAKTPVYTTPKFRKLLDQKFELEAIIQQKKQQQFQIRGLTETQQKAMKVKHFTMHLPAYTTPEQYQFIKSVAVDVLNNRPVTVVHEKAMQSLLKWAYMYRNILTEFDEQDRWSEEDNETLEKIAREFKPILDWLVEKYRIDVGTFRRD